MEDVSTTEEVPKSVATASLDSALCQKLLDLPAPKAYLVRTGVKSVHMDQILLFGKIDVLRLMKILEKNTIVARVNANIVDVQ